MPKKSQRTIDPGTPVEMTKGYKGVRGVVLERTESEFDFYVLKLDNGIHIIAGPSAFTSLAAEGTSRQ